MVWGTKGTADGELRSPNVIEVDPVSGDIYVAQSRILASKSLPNMESTF